jgi:hypothetical protein
MTPCVILIRQLAEKDLIKFYEDSNFIPSA